MAFCTNCGSKLSEGAKFCANCGTKVEEITVVEETIIETTVEEQTSNDETNVEEQTINTETNVKEQTNNDETNAEEPLVASEANISEEATSSESNSQTTEALQSVDVTAAKQKIKAIPKFVWALVIVVILAIIALSIFLSQRKHTLDINDYIEVEFTGYDSMGKCNADWSVDFWDAFYEKAAKIPASSDYDIMIKKLKYDISSTEGLSNGDKVTVKWNVDTSYFKKYYGLNIKSPDKVYKVSSLEEVETINPFDGIEIVFSGIEGEGRADYTVTSTDPIYDDLDFYIHDQIYLSTGDTIVVELEMQDAYSEDNIIDECASKYGKIPTQFEKKYTVSGLGKYVTKADELTEENMKKLLQTSEDALEEETTGYTWDRGASMTKKNYLGTYVLTEKNHGDNKVYVVYQVTVDIDIYDQTDRLTYYTYVQFSDVTIQDDGTIDCDASYYYRPYSFTYDAEIEDSYWTVRYSFDGYETLSELDDDIVTGNLSRYDSDTNVSM